MLAARNLVTGVLIAALTLSLREVAWAGGLCIRFSSSPSHGAALYLRLECEREGEKPEQLGYIGRDGLLPQPPPPDGWLKPGEVGPWIIISSLRPGEAGHLTLTAFTAGGEVSSYTMILDVAPRPNGAPILLHKDDPHSIILPIQGSQFRFTVSLDERGLPALFLGPSAVEEWVKGPDLAAGGIDAPCPIATDLAARRLIMLGTCGYHQPDGNLRAKIRDLTEFYRGLSLNFVYDLYTSNASPWEGDWPTICNDVRASVALLHREGIAVSQAVLGRWLGQEAFRHPESRLVNEIGRAASNQFCPRKIRLQQEVVGKLFRHIPFDGFHVEEPSTAMCYCVECQRAFRQYLAEQRKSRPSDFFFAEPLDVLRAPKQDERFTRRDVWWHWFWFTLRTYRDYYCSLFDSAKRATKTAWNKDCLTMTSIGYSGVVIPMMGARHTDFLAHPAVSGMLNALYWHCGEKVTVDSFKDYHLQTSWCKGQSLGKPVWFYIVGKSTRQPLQTWWFEAEVYDSLLAGLDGFIIWPPPDEKSPELIAGIKRAFGFVRQNMDYLSGTESCAQAAIAYNYDQTNYELFGPDYKASKSHPHFCEHVRAIFHVLSDLHVPADYVASLTPDSLKRYRLLVLDDLRCVTDEQAAAIRNWVKAGGALLAMGDSTSCNLYEQPRPAYALADVFGVARLSRKLDSPSKVDLGDEADILNGLSGRSLAYGADLFMYWRFHYKRLQEGYALEPHPAALVLARWGDGAPAMVASEYGRGRCIYSGAFLQFIPAEMRIPLARRLIRWLLRNDLPVICDGLPASCDVNVLKKGERLFVHLLNLRQWRLSGDPYKPTELKQWAIERATPLENLRVTVAVPSGLRVFRARMLSPESPSPQPIDVRIIGDRASLVVPRLDLYCIVVLD